MLLQRISLINYKYILISFQDFYKIRIDLINYFFVFSMLQMLQSNLLQL